MDTHGDPAGERSENKKGNRTPGAQPPDESERAELRKPHRVAAGIKALTESLRFTIRETGFTRGIGDWLRVNKKDGFDCQSCAWPSPDYHRHVFEFCENGVKALTSEATRKKITPEFFRKHSIADLQRQSDNWLELQGRLVHPMVKRAGATHYEAIEWDEVFAFLAHELNALPTPNAAAFYTSGRTSNEAAFLYQLFVRQFGTNNLPDCSNMCHESSGVALTESIGIGKATVRLPDFEATDLVIVIGQNPGTNAPRMMSSLQDAKRAGAKMIAINPLPEAGLLNFVQPNPQHYPNPLSFPIAIIGNKPTQLADLHLAVRIGGDMAVLKGMMKVMLEREREAPGSVFDNDFIAAKTEGFDELVANLDEASWDDIFSESGLTRQQITEAAEMFISANRVITCWAMGLTQHKTAVATIQDVVNLHLLRGQIGKAGAGLCPVRGHSNVQGDRTMGIWEKVNEKFAAGLESKFGFTVPRRDGLNTVE